MKSINIFLYDDSNMLLKQFKKGESSNDYSIYNMKKDNAFLCVFSPNNYPEKIKSLLYSIYLSDFALIKISKIDKYLAEISMALTFLDIPGLILLDGIGTDDLKIFENTIFSKYKKIDFNEINFIDLKEKLFSLSFELQDKEKTYGVIDNIYDIKSVGLVILGQLKQGCVKVHDQITIIPSKINCQIKNMQLHDDNVNEIFAKNRFGINLKNIKSDQILKGSYLVKNTEFEVFKEIQGQIEKSFIYFEKLENKKNLFLCSGLQFKQCDIKNKDNIFYFNLSQEIALIKNEKILVIDNDSKKQRIVGILKKNK